MAEEQKQTVKLEINWVQAASGALAAITSAVLLSTVGVAGTLIGAALGSLAVSVGSALYSYYLRASRARVAAAARIRAERLHARRDQHGAHLPPPLAPELESPPTAVEQPPPRWTAALAGLPWKRVAIVAAALFAVAMALILSFEALTGRPVAAYTGGTSRHSTGTSIPGLGGGADPGQPSAPTPASPAPSQHPTDVPTGSTSGGTPTPTSPSVVPSSGSTPAEPTPTASLPASPTAGTTPGP
jgi:hypothetical protein